MISPPTQVLEITGADAAAFAHAQFCNDVLALPDGQLAMECVAFASGPRACVLSPAAHRCWQVLLTLRGGDAEWLRAELARYVFRAKVQLRVVNEACHAVGMGAVDKAAPNTRASPISAQGCRKSASS